MKRLVLTIASAVLVAASFPRFGSATGPFDQRLSPDQQIVHALNRLTFGPRPGDVEEVRRIGLTKWIEHPVAPRPNPRKSRARRQAEAARNRADEFGRNRETVHAAATERPR